VLLVPFFVSSIYPIVAIY